MQRTLNSIKQIIYIVIVGIAVLLPGACSVISGSSGSDTPTYPVIKAKKRPLTIYEWEDLLDECAKYDSVTLDLSDCEVPSYDSVGQWSSLTNARDTALSNHVLFVWREDFFIDLSTGSRIPDSLPINNECKEWVVFDPKRDISTGKDKIVEIILPDKAQIIREGVGTSVAKGTTGIDAGIFVHTITAATFNHFTRLKRVKGANVKQIGKYAFANLKSLERVEFPEVTHEIGPYELATTMATVYGVEVTGPYKDEFWGRAQKDIDYAAFYGCTALNDVRIPNAKYISRAAFQGCTSLKSVNFPFVWILDQHAFEGCTGLTQVSFSALTKISNYAFKDCKNLTTASFAGSVTVHPSDITALNNLQLPIGTCGNSSYGVDSDTDLAYKYSAVIYDGVFIGCKALRTVEMRNAWNVHFGSHAFADIGETLDIYLSDKKHSLNDVLSFGFDVSLYNFTSITLKTINLHGLSSANFDYITGEIDKFWGNTSFDQSKPKPRITFVLK